MELILPTASIQISPLSRTKVGTGFHHRSHNAFQQTGCFPSLLKSEAPVRRKFKISSGILETAASIAVATTIVGAAATILVKRTQTSQTIEAPTKVCDDCGGSGICPACQGEGFVLKKLSDANAEKARLLAKNAATRYTAGLPKKWGYCTRCSSARACSSCGGSGKISS